MHTSTELSDTMQQSTSALFNRIMQSDNKGKKNTGEAMWKRVNMPQ